jgi:hypothetical protein
MRLDALFLSLKTTRTETISEANAILGESHALLDLRDGLGGVEALGARSRAIENSVASVQAHAVVESLLAFCCALVTRIGQPAVRLQ